MSYPGPKVVDPHDPVGVPLVDVPAHADLGPSSSSRWMNCTASVKLVEQTIERNGRQPAGEYAALGTALHAAAEKCVNDEVTALSIVDLEFEGYTFEYDHIEAIDDYVLYCMGLKATAEYFALEKKVTVVPGLVWGTADCLAVSDGVLYVVDLKTGFNRVEAPGNSQLMLYGLGAHLALKHVYEYDQVELVIGQPRIGNMDSVRLDVSDLEAFGRSLDRALEEINHDPQFRPSDSACRWCEARATCPALLEAVHDQAQQDFAEMEHHQLQEAWENLPMLEHYISGVKAAIMGHLERGQPVQGLKLVQGRRTRAWRDEGAVERYLSRRIPKFKNTAYSHKLLSPAQMEKLVKRLGDDLHKPAPKLGDLVEFKVGKPVITSEDDRRPALVIGDSAASDFADVES